MTFYVEGRTRHELMPIEKLFNERRVEKTHEVDSSHPVENKEVHLTNNSNTQRIKSTYQQIEHFLPETQVVFAEQIMSSPVVALAPDSSVNQAFKLFHKHQFRHVPVTTRDKKLQGIISDRDILRILGNHAGSDQEKIKISEVMITEVLTASRKTDVRYITRLFVENRIGSMPVMEDRKLVGMITRSDILKAVLNHYELELWV